MNYPTKDDVTGLQINSQINPNTDSNNLQILSDPERNLGSVKDDKFDIATKDNAKDDKTIDFKDKLNLISSNFKKFLGFVGPGYGKKFFLLFADLFIGRIE